MNERPRACAEEPMDVTAEGRGDYNMAAAR